MPEFAYIAVDRSGKRTQGTLTAVDRASALASVTQRGLFPVSIDERRHGNGNGNGKAAHSSTMTLPRPQPIAKPTTPAETADASTGRIPPAAIENFTRELANLLSGGVPLARALSILRRESSQPAVRAMWESIHDAVSEGVSLADAMARFPRSFPPVYIAMVRAGETGGFLDVVLGQIADFRARERDLLGKVKAAMIYPCVLATLAVGVVIFCLTYFIPKFSSLFNEFGAGLPWLTQVVVAISESFYSYGLLFALALIVGIIAVQRFKQTDMGRRKLERLMLATPRLGNVMARFALVRFTRMLGTLLGAGVPLMAALRVAREAIGNQTLIDAVARATEDVQRGASLARGLASTPMLFPPSVVEMIAIAEETGRLDKELMRIAATYEDDLDRQLRMLVALAEPVMLFFMAGLIGTIVVAMLLPIFSLQDLIK